MPEMSATSLLGSGIGGLFAVMVLLFKLLLGRVSALEQHVNAEIHAQTEARNEEGKLIWSRMTDISDKAAAANQQIMDRLGQLATRADMQALADRIERVRDRISPHGGD